MKSWRDFEEAKSREDIVESGEWEKRKKSSKKNFSYNENLEVIIRKGIPRNIDFRNGWCAEISTKGRECNFSAYPYWRNTGRTRIWKGIECMIYLTACWLVVIDAHSFAKNCPFATFLIVLKSILFRWMVVLRWKCWSRRLPNVVHGLTDSQLDR